MTDFGRWVSRADRIRDGDGYTFEDLARDMVDALGWTAAVDVACALRSHVYGWSGGHPLHQDVRPLYDRLGWEQAALVCCWFRDSRNRPSAQAATARLELPTSGRRSGGWPAAASPDDSRMETP